MATVRKDAFSRNRIKSVIKFTLIIGVVLALFLYMAMAIVGIITFINAKVNAKLSIAIMILGICWLATSLLFVFKEYFNVQISNTNATSKWKNEIKWFLFLLLSLNLLFIFVAYIYVQRKIYNALF